MEQIAEIESLYEQTEANQSVMGSNHEKTSTYSKMSGKTAKTFKYTDDILITQNSLGTVAADEEESSTSSSEDERHRLAKSCSINDGDDGDDFIMPRPESLNISIASPENNKMAVSA